MPNVFGELVPREYSLQLLVQTHDLLTKKEWLELRKIFHIKASEAVAELFTGDDTMFEKLDTWDVKTDDGTEV